METIYQLIGPFLPEKSRFVVCGVSKFLRFQWLPKVLLDSSVVFDYTMTCTREFKLHVKWLKCEDRLPDPIDYPRLVHLDLHTQLDMAHPPSLKYFVTLRSLDLCYAIVMIDELPPNITDLTLHEPGEAVRIIGQQWPPCLQRITFNNVRIHLNFELPYSLTTVACLSGLSLILRDKLKKAPNLTSLDLDTLTTNEFLEIYSNDLAATLTQLHVRSHVWLGGSDWPSNLTKLHFDQHPEFSVNFQWPSNLTTLIIHICHYKLFPLLPPFPKTLQDLRISRDGDMSIQWILDMNLPNLRVLEAPCCFINNLDHVLNRLPHLTHLTVKNIRCPFRKDREIQINCLTV